jgi:DNA-binding NarL/FixJ family response regulator
MHDESLYAERVLRAGGRGYIMKREGGARFLEAVRSVLSDRIYVSDRISTPLLEALSGQMSHESRPPLAQLTDREFEVFQLIGQGLTTGEIATRLRLGTKTVDTHRLRIKDKLRLRTTPELVKYAVRWAATQEKT